MFSWLHSEINFYLSYKHINCWLLVTFPLGSSTWLLLWDPDLTAAFWPWCYLFGVRKRIYLLSSSFSKANFLIFLLWCSPCRLFFSSASDLVIWADFTDTAATSLPWQDAENSPGVILPAVARVPSSHFSTAMEEGGGCLNRQIHAEFVTLEDRKILSCLKWRSFVHSLYYK